MQESQVRDALIKGGVSQEKIEASNRKQKRRMLSIRHGQGGMLSRFRSGVRTGTTPHFRMWMADLKMKSALQRTKTLEIAHNHPAPQTGAAYLMAHRGGYRTIWSLVQASEADLLTIPQMGPVRVRLLKADLASRNVSVNW
jgi:hypothetical protein